MQPSLDNGIEGSHSGPGPASSLPFAGAALVTFGCAALIYQAHPPSPPVLALTLAAVLASMGFLVAPSWMQHRAKSARELAIAVQRVEERLFDIEGVRREHRKAQARSEAVLESASRLVGTLEDVCRAVLEAAALKEELGAARQALQRQEKLTGAWAEGLMDYCDGQIRALALPGLSPEYAQAVDRALRELQRTLESLGLDVIWPGPGDPFQDRLHQAVEGAADGRVLDCLRLGFRRGEAVIRKAEVRLGLVEESA